MFTLLRSSIFKRDVTKYIAKGGSEDRLDAALELLRTGDEMPPWFRDHSLQGKLHGVRELHLSPDWLLVYRRDGKNLTVMCLWLVTHQKLRERERSMG
jgi:mRNA interferase YafQ